MKFVVALVFIHIASDFCGAVEKNSYDKSCFIKYLLKHNQIDEKYNKYGYKNQTLDAKCQMAIDSAIKSMQTVSKDECVINFLRSKGVPEVLMKKYLAPQLDNGQDKITFNENFTTFRSKVLNITTIVCRNQKIFRPNVAQIMNDAKEHKDTRAGELKCIELYIKRQTDQMSHDCWVVVEYARNNFYQTLENDARAAFMPPNDNLVDINCGKQKAYELKFFERVFFFVVLATTKNLNDRQINTIAKSTDNAILNSQKFAFECMN
jgi:hypothetical protein